MTDDATQRLAQLLARQMEQSLSSEETAEKERLLATHGDWSEEDLELAAAAASLAWDADALVGDEALPDGLEERVLDQAKGFFAHEPSSAVPVIDLRRVSSEPSPEPRRPSALMWAGWVVAAVALLTLGTTTVYRVGGADDVPANVVAQDPCPDGEQETEPTLAEHREKLLAHSATVQWSWENTQDELSGGIRGDVVWNAHEQVGFMHFSGLPKNHPKEAQYQLWIFDKERDEAHPVDGGVFDVVDGEVIVRIDPRVPIHEATLFAVTLEKPGGVVVSTRERLVVLAKPG